MLAASRTHSIASGRTQAAAASRAGAGQLSGATIGRQASTATERSSRRANLNQTQERTEFLINTLGSGAALAGLLGVNRSQPTQWRKGAESPSPEVGRGLLDLDYVVARASMLWPTDSVVAWLQGQNAFLEGARPIDVLRARGSRDVIDALDAELAGSYA